MVTTPAAVEPEPTKGDRARSSLIGAIAGQGIVRRVVLYAVVVAALVSVATANPLVGLGAIALVLLIATDTGLA